MEVETRIEGSDLMGSARASNRRRWIVIGFVALAIALIGVWFIMSKDKEGAQDTAAEANANVPVVTVVVPGRVDVDRVINATGSLAARREVPISVVGEGGRVVVVHADAGSWVSQGQVLVTIERSVQVEQTAALRAQIQSAEANLRLAQNELSRALALVSRGFISKADVDQKTANRDAAQASLNVARASLNEQQARNARLDIRAPSAGLILSRSVQVGQVVSAGGGALFTMAQGGEMELAAQLNEADLATVSVGVPAKVTPVGATAALQGQIWQVSPIVDATTRQGTARIALAYDHSIRPGGFANAQIIAGRVSAPMLPESAIQSDQKGNYVYIVNDKTNKVERRDVKLGTVTDVGIVIAEGLSGMEKVVLRAGGFLNPGEAVKPQMQKK